MNNLKYELMNVLYNLAALYAQLAINTPRGNTDGLKTAANYFSLAAGILSHMQSEVLPDLRMPAPPDDMDDHTLECLKQLMLSQSQECFWQKAVMDGYKDASIAKLAARVSDLYNFAAEAAVQSEAVSSAWIHHMTVKHHHFAAAAQYRAACDCLEKRRFGEEVSRLHDAVACVNEGIKAARGGFVNKVVVEDLQGLKRRVEEDLKRAEKDNDVIYLRKLISAFFSTIFLTKQNLCLPSRNSRYLTEPIWQLHVHPSKSRTPTTRWAKRPSLGLRYSPALFRFPYTWPFPSTRSEETILSTRILFSRWKQ